MQLAFSVSEPSFLNPVLTLIIGNSTGFLLVSVGKAAGRMAQGCAVAAATHGGSLRAAVVVEKSSAALEGLPAAWHTRVGGHPVPDARSLAAGEVVLRFLADAPAGMPLLVALSGGGSALMEALAPGVSLEDLQALNRQLLADGVPIAEMNLQRRRLSRLKGGGLARAMGERPAAVLVLSDVIGNDLDVVASGPFRDPERPVPHVVVGDAASAVASGTAEAERQGLIAQNGGLWTDRAALVAELQHQVERSPMGGFAWIGAGECPVAVPPDAGRGGRCQHLAAEVAEVIAGRAGWAFLAMGSDGDDGPDGAAGGVVDGDSARRTPGLVEALRAYDAGSWLAREGGLLRTGPTGTNVNDLYVLVHTPDP